MKEAKEQTEKIVIVPRGIGCLGEIIIWVIGLIIFVATFYFIHNSLLNKATQRRIESNTLVVNQLRGVSDRIYDLSDLEITEINSQSAKALFIFYRQEPRGKTQTTLELEAYKIGGGVYKIHNLPIEISFGLKTAYWFDEHIIKPQLPEYNFLLATPYSLEFCTGLGECKMLKKAIGFDEDNGKFSYIF
jgi:hypothetical protein